MDKKNQNRIYTTLTVLCFWIITLNCFSQNIYSVAGFTAAGFSSGGDINGGTATAAQLDFPSGVTVDASGNVYIIDYGNNRIRKVNTSGNIFTVAGMCTTTGSYSGDGGQATDARFRLFSGNEMPVGICFDASGNYYIADQGNHRIRKVTVATGVITTVAGNGTAGFLGDAGQATDARLNRPTGVAVDAAGDIYIADRNNHRIRKVTVATGIITSIAGDGTGAFAGDGGQATAARIYRPTSVAVDNAAGNLFIADFSNNRIRKVNTSGVISTVAGYTTTLGYSGDGGQATAADLNLNAGSVDASVAVAVDASGNFYIADVGNVRIRKVTVATGIITTVAGTGTSGYNGDGIAATAADLQTPRGVWVDASGHIYIAVRGSNRVRKVDASTGIISTIAGTGVRGNFANNGIAASTQLVYPQDLALDAGGNTYIAMDGGFGVVWKISPAGVIAAVAGTGTLGNTGDGGQATLATVDISAVAVDASCNLYLMQDNYCIRKVTASTGIISTIIGTGVQGFSGDGGQATSAQIDCNGNGVHVGIAVDASGNIYFTDKENERIRKVTASTGIITTIAGDGINGFAGDGGQATAARLRQPRGIDIDASGNIYIADTDNLRIRKISTATGIITTIAGDGNFFDLGDGGQATAASFLYPCDVVVDKTSGDFYISDIIADRVRKVTVSTGIITAVAGNGTAGFSGDAGAATAAQLLEPLGIAVSDGSGCLYIADRSNSRVRFVDFGGSCASVPGSCPLVLPIQLLSFNVTCEAPPGLPKGQPKVANEVQVILRWSTATETNNNYFAIERSTDGKIWSEIGTIKGAGNSSSTQEYSFTDSELPTAAASPTFFYRLKQTDYNGEHEYFGPVASSCSMDDNWKMIIQNIVGSSLNGTLIAGEDAELTLNIVDIQGRIIKQKKISASKGSNLLQIELDSMDAGMYFITLYNRNVKLYRKFIKHTGPY